MDDGKRIWKHFQRFAEYTDLKDLYHRCIPELAKFEQKIMDFNEQVYKFEQIVCNFDHKMLTKVDKTAIEEIQYNIQETYLSKELL